jgi:molybdenum cofactor guanylyltransferase
MRVAGAVLCGGQSRRMGTDKALLHVDGQPMARRVHDALVQAGCSPVIAVGGDLAALRDQGLVAVPDDYPGQGPLGAIITALGHLRSEADAVMILACDLADASPLAVAEVCAPFADDPTIDVVLPRSDTRRHMHHALWRTSALTALRDVFDQGERAPRRALELLKVHELTVNAPHWAAWLADIDSPADLLRRRDRPPLHTTLGGDSSTPGGRPRP